MIQQGRGALCEPSSWSQNTIPRGSQAPSRWTNQHREGTCRATTRSQRRPADGWKAALLRNIRGEPPFADDASAQGVRYVVTSTHTSSNSKHSRKKLPAGDPSREPPFRAGTLIRLLDVCRFLGISTSTVYKKLSESSFPEPARLGPRTVRWCVDDIEAWRDAHSASQTNYVDDLLASSRRQGAD